MGVLGYGLQRVLVGPDSVGIWVGGQGGASVARQQPQLDVIKRHIREEYGRFSDMARDDPNRDHYIRGLSLQNALNPAVIGFGVADLAIGNGVVIILLGVATLGFGLPATYLLG